MQPQYNQGAAPSHHPPPYTPPKVLQPNGGSTTSSLRQWRKKDFVEKQTQPETNQSSTNENPSHIARVAPHTYYPRPSEEPCNYQQYGLYSGTYKPPAPVKYSEIVENQTPQTIEHITPVIQKQKEKEYVEMCNGPIQPHIKQYPDHAPIKQSAYSDSLPISHQYIPKDSQMYPFLQKQSQLHQYMQKEPYQQFLSKYSVQSQFSPQYGSQPNDFLAHLNKINPRMAQSIINDTHLRDSQIPAYPNLDQNRPYPQPQRIYHSPTGPCNLSNPQRGLGPAYNYPQYNYNIKPNISPGDPYNRVHQYHHNASKYVPEQHIPNVSPQRYYNEHVNYGPFPPNYPQLEYAQHYQHRRQFPQDYYLHPSYKGSYAQNVPPEGATSESSSRKSSLKQYLESWVEEDMVGNAPDIIAPNQLNSSVDNIETVKGTMSMRGGDTQDQPLYVLDTTDIPNDNLPHFLHLQQVEKLPDNIKGYYQSNERESDRKKNSPAKESDRALPGAIIPEIFDQECRIVATVENDQPDERITAGEDLQNKVVQIHILENTESVEIPVIIAGEQERQHNEGVIKMCKKNVVTSDLSDKSMPEINDEGIKSTCNVNVRCIREVKERDDLREKAEIAELPNDTYTPALDENNGEVSAESVITNLEEAIVSDELVISKNCDTENIPKDLRDITNNTNNTSKDYETLEKTDLNSHYNSNQNPSATFSDYVPKEEKNDARDNEDVRDTCATNEDENNSRDDANKESVECLNHLLDEFQFKTKEGTLGEFEETNRFVEETEKEKEELETSPPVLQKCVEEQADVDETVVPSTTKRKRSFRENTQPERCKKIKTADAIVERSIENSPREESPPVLEEEELREIEEDVSMPVLERETQDENETNVVYHIDDANVVLQIGDELLEINVSVQNDKKIIMVKTFSDAVIINGHEESSCPVLEDQTSLDMSASIIENVSNIETVEEICETTDIPIANDVCVYNEEIVSSSTETETVPKLTAANEIVSILEDRDEKVQARDEASSDVNATNKCLEYNNQVKKNFKTKAALKLVEPQELIKVPCKTRTKRSHLDDASSKLKKKGGVKTKCNKTKQKEQRKIESRNRDPDASKKKIVRDPRIKEKEEKRDKMRKNNIDMLYKMSIVPNKLPKSKIENATKGKEERANVEKKVQFVSVQEHSITSSTCQDAEANDPRKRVNKLIQQINDDWEDDCETVKQEDVIKKRLSLQEYNDRKRNQEDKVVDYDKLDLTSNLLQSVCKRRGTSPKSSPKLNVAFTNRTYSRGASEKKDEPLSSGIELHLPNRKRLFPRPNYNQEYLKNALMNDLHTVNQITATLMKENQQLMQRFLEQQRLTASELKKVKQIIRYKRLVQHLTHMKLKETQSGGSTEEISKFNSLAPTKTEVPKCSEKRKKKRFRFLHSDSESEIHEPSSPPDGIGGLKQAHIDNLVSAVDYSVHQSNSQGQLTLVFKRSFKSDPKMQPFVKLERIRSLDWLASNLQ